MCARINGGDWEPFATQRRLRKPGKVVAPMAGPNRRILAQRIWPKSLGHLPIEYWPDSSRDAVQTRCMIAVLTAVQMTCSRIRTELTRIAGSLRLNHGGNVRTQAVPARSPSQFPEAFMIRLDGHGWTHRHSPENEAIAKLRCIEKQVSFRFVPG